MFQSGTAVSHIDIRLPHILTVGRKLYYIDIYLRVRIGKFSAFHLPYIEIQIPTGRNVDFWTSNLDNYRTPGSIF